jgi:hypothetical protein
MLIEDITGFVARFRGIAESYMVDECEIRRPDVVGALNTSTGAQPVTPGTLVYSGKCKVFTYEPAETVSLSGQHAATVQRYRLHIPVATSGVQVDDVATITVAAYDPQLAGNSYRVAGLLQMSLGRDQRLMVEEVTG